MTADEAPPVPPPLSYDTAKRGCSWPGCGTQDTETLSNKGRRCADHPPGFDPDRAVQLMTSGKREQALDYIAAEVYRQPCPVCRTEITVLDGGVLAYHYTCAGIGLPCPGSGEAA